MNVICRVWIGCTLLLLLSRSPAAAQTDSPYVSPDDIGFRQATIISEGTRIAAELFSLKSNEDKSLPTIIMCHGWGGTAEHLRPDAVVFARAGYFVVSLDYRGWGASEGRVILTGQAGHPIPERSVSDCLPSVKHYAKIQF